MITLEELQVWKDRWASLEKTMEDTEIYYQNQQAASSWQQTLSYLVSNLRLFAKEQFNMFCEGFGPEEKFEPEPEPAEGSEEPFPKYPPEYPLSTLLDQAGFDLEILQRIGQQRRGINEDTLDRADKLAWKALKPVVGDNKLIKDNRTTVLTYFQKSSSIRIIPYAPVALVGIPFTATAVPRDYLAIPHEVGHYVYRNGKCDGDKSISETLDERVPTSPEYIKNWMEEIFADVYGCLVAGPVIALDFQDLQLVRNGRGFIMDDADHPVPFLRPYIYTYVLENKEDFKQSACELIKHWELRLSKRNDPDTFTTATRTQSNREAARRNMEMVIDKIFALFADTPMEQWAGGLGTNEKVENLYDRFTTDHIDDLIAEVRVNGLIPEVKTEAVDPGKRSIGESLPKIPFEDWEKRIDIGGWNTQGPNGRGP